MKSNPCIKMYQNENPEKQQSFSRTSAGFDTRNEMNPKNNKAFHGRLTKQRLEQEKPRKKNF